MTPSRPRHRVAHLGRVAALAAMALAASSCGSFVDWAAEEAANAEPPAREGTEIVLDERDDVTVVDADLMIPSGGIIQVIDNGALALEIDVGLEITEVFDDLEGGLVYATDAAGGRGLTVHHLAAGSRTPTLLVEGATAVHDVAILAGRPKVLASRDTFGAATLTATGLDGRSQDLFALPETAWTVTAGGGRVAITHLADVELGDDTQRCSWVEVVDATGRAIVDLPPIPARDDCGSGQISVPARLSDDGDRLGWVTPLGIEDNVTFLDLATGREQVLVLRNVQGIDLSRRSGLVTSPVRYAVVPRGGTALMNAFPRGFSAGTARSAPPKIGLHTEIASGAPVITDLDEVVPPDPEVELGDDDLVEGREGPEVLAFQLDLQRWRTLALPEADPLVLTGVMDEPTSAAVVEFEAAVSLEEDGIVTDADREILRQATSDLEVTVGRLQRGMGGPIVRAWQTDLARWWELSGADGRAPRPDGIYGRGTEDAMRRFEETVGTTVNGVVDPADREALYAILAAASQADGPQAAESGEDDG